MDVKKMLEWVNTLCEEARDSANSGDVTKANALAKSPAMRDYWTNVFMLRSITEGDFLQWYPAKVKELYTLYEAYQQQTAQAETVQGQGDRLTALEQKFDTMMQRLEAFMEAQETDSEPEPEPEQPKKRRASTKRDAVDSETEDQPDPADDAEEDTDEAE